MDKWSGAKFLPRGGAQAGMSLLGVLMATTLLAAAILAVTSLTARAQRIVGLGRENFVAANLAREGVELVRAYRDNNWLAKDSAIAWWTDLCDADGNGYEFLIDPEVVRTRVFADVADPVLYITGGQWNHFSTQNALPTIYRRVIATDCSERESALPKITVSAQVSWRSRNQDRVIEVKEELYDWYAAQ